MAKGRRYRFRKMEFWAERGLINVIDERFPPSHENFYNIRTVPDFLLTLQGFSDMIKSPKIKLYPDERNEYLTMIENGVRVAREAKSQGRPDDPKAVAQMLRERRNSMLHAGSPVGAIPASVAPEQADLPPIPKADPNKPVTPLLPNPLSVKAGRFGQTFL